jgi:hypothetical protein
LGRIVLLLALTGLVAATLTLGFLFRPGAGVAVSRSPGPVPQSTFSLTQARGFSGWPLYDLGPSFEGYPLVAVLRHQVTSPVDPDVTKIRPNYVSFIYGDCDPGAGSCAPPLEIQVSPACLYTPADIELPDSGRTEVRGVPGVFYEDGAKIVLLVGRSTVVVYGSSREQVLRAAEALAGVNIAIAPEGALPPPAVADDPVPPTC